MKKGVKDRCNACIAQACRVEAKIQRLTRRVINFLNEGRTNNPCFSAYNPRVPLQLSEEYYEELVADEHLNFEAILRLISCGLLKKCIQIDRERVSILEGKKLIYYLDL